jgi:putative glutamine amidotransferase
MARPPRIGVTTRSNDKPYLDRWARNYYWAILWAGGDPVLLTPETALLPPAEQIAQLDGLFLTGGGDVHPRHFNQPLGGAEPEEIHDARDELEIPLIRAGLAVDLPILGVCRGIQVLNIAAGGGLLQHVDGHRSPADRTAYHEVDIVPDTLLACVLGLDGYFTTNPYHHQAVTPDMLAPGFVAAATTTEGPRLLEAMVGARWRWVLGVQWHPERFYELEPAHRLIFGKFVEAATQR